MKPAPQNLVVISIGSNLGDSSRIIQDALDRLSMFADGPVLRSSLWRTQPVDCPPGSPPFLNAAAAFIPKTRETPESLLTQLKKMEAEFGRKTKKVLNEPRPLDLDIITFQTELRSAPDLIVPHPRAHLRAFVLAPIVEIVPNLVIPGQTLTVTEFLSQLPPGQQSAVRRQASKP